MPFVDDISGRQGQNQSQPTHPMRPTRKINKVAGQPKPAIKMSQLSSFSGGASFKIPPKRSVFTSSNNVGTGFRSKTKASPLESVLGGIKDSSGGAVMRPRGSETAVSTGGESLAISEFNPEKKRLLSQLKQRIGRSVDVSDQERTGTVSPSHGSDSVALRTFSASTDIPGKVSSSGGAIPVIPQEQVVRRDKDQDKLSMKKIAATSPSILRVDQLSHASPKLYRGASRVVDAPFTKGARPTEPDFDSPLSLAEILKKKNEEKAKSASETNVFKFKETAAQLKISGDGNRISKISHPLDGDSEFFRLTEESAKRKVEIKADHFCHASTDAVLVRASAPSALEGISQPKTFDSHKPSMSTNINNQEIPDQMIGRDSEKLGTDAISSSSVASISSIVPRVKAVPAVVHPTIGKSHIFAKAPTRKVESIVPISANRALIGKLQSDVDQLMKVSYYKKALANFVEKNSTLQWINNAQELQKSGETFATEKCEAVATLCEQNFINATESYHDGSTEEEIFKDMQKTSSFDFAVAKLLNAEMLNSLVRFENPENFNDTEFIAAIDSFCEKQETQLLQLNEHHAKFIRFPLLES